MMWAGGEAGCTGLDWARGELVCIETSGKSQVRPHARGSSLALMGQALGWTAGLGWTGVGWGRVDCSGVSWSEWTGWSVAKESNGLEWSGVEWTGM